MTEADIKRAEDALRAADPILGRLIDSQVITPISPRTNYYASLVRSIIGQQVSVAAARAIAARFESHTHFDPSKATRLQESDIKAIGLSKQKAAYIQDISRHFLADPGVYNHLETQSDEAVVAELTAIKGVGTWTAQMFLMFTLGRPDVFAPDDGGLQRAMLKLYAWDALPPKRQLGEVAKAWHPYRTVASLHLWQSLDNKPV